MTHRDNIKLDDCLHMQLSEIEMLQSMFPSSNEFSLDESVVLSEIEDCLEDELKLKTLRTRICFCLKLKSRDHQVNTIL